MVSRETYGMILICIAIFPCKTIADVNMCHEDGVKVIRTESCRGGVTPKYTIRSSGDGASVTYRQPLRSQDRLPSNGNLLDPTFTQEAVAVAYRRQSRPQAIVEPSYSNAARDSLRANAYGPGVNANQYGQAVTVAPDFGGVTGEVLQLNQNAFGPSVHMDQYGRPVRERPIGQ